MTKRLKLLRKIPISAFEGLSASIKSDLSFDLLFHQTLEEDDITVTADVVGAIHIPNKAKWEEIKELVDSQLEEASKIEK